MSESNSGDLRALLARTMEASGIDPGPVLADADRRREAYEAERARALAAQQHQKSPARAAAELEAAEAMMDGESSPARAAELAAGAAAGIAAAFDPTGASELPEAEDLTPEPGETFARVNPPAEPDPVRGIIGALRSAEAARAPKPSSGTGRGGRSKRRRSAASNAHLDRYRSKLRELGQLDANPRELPRWAWGFVAMIMADNTGGCARAALADLPQAVYVLVRRAARGRRQDGQPRYGWETTRCRATVALGVLLWKLRERTGRKGWIGVIRGIPRNLWRSLFINPATGFTYSTNSLFGTKHRGEAGQPGRWQDGTCGYMVALCRVGFMYRQQPPFKVVGAGDRGTAYAINLYWLHSRLTRPTDDPDAEDVAAELVAKYRRPRGRPRARAPGS